MAKSGKNPRSEEDLDSLVRQASVRHAGGMESVDQRDTVTLMKQEQNKFYIKWGLVAAVAAVGLTMVVWMFISSRMEASRKNEKLQLAAKDEQNRIDQLISETTEEVQQAVKTRELGAARLALDTANQKGLPHETFVDLNALIIRTARQDRDKLVDQLEARTEAGEIDTDALLLEKIRALDGIAGPDDRRSAAEQNYNAKMFSLEEKARKDKEQQIIATTVATISESRSAAAARNWDEAIRLLEKARSMPIFNNEVDSWAVELQRKVGGRLRIRSNAKKFWVWTVGGEKIEGGEVVAGLPEGPVDITVQGDGYIPETRHYDVSYPNVTKKFVELTPETPAPVWAASIVKDRCARYALEEFYLQDPANAKLAGAMRKAAPPCEKPSKSQLEDDALTEKLTEEISDLTKQSEPLIHRLHDLGRFLAKYPASSSAFMANTSFKTAMNQITAQLEKGCGDCLGTTMKPCEACEGVGKRVERRPCSACGAKGNKKHPPCKGTGRKKCSKCKGKGRVRESVPGSGTFKKFNWVSCGKCGKSGKENCNGCSNGLVSCTGCQGSGQKDAMGKCTKCMGELGAPCKSCEQTGARDRMNAVTRKAMERTAAELLKKE